MKWIRRRPMILNLKKKWIVHSRNSGSKFATNLTVTLYFSMHTNAAAPADFTHGSPFTMRTNAAATAFPAQMSQFTMKTSVVAPTLFAHALARSMLTNTRPAT